MQTFPLKPNDKINIRLYTYKSFRHYGGRNVKTSSQICKAEYLYDNYGQHSFMVRLLEDCAGYLKNNVMSILPKDFNI